MLYDAKTSLCVTLFTAYVWVVCGSGVRIMVAYLDTYMNCSIFPQNDIASCWKHN